VRMSAFASLTVAAVAISAITTGGSLAAQAGSNGFRFQCAEECTYQIGDDCYVWWKHCWLVDDNDLKNSAMLGSKPPTRPKLTGQPASRTQGCQTLSALSSRDRMLAWD